MLYLFAQKSLYNRPCDFGAKTQKAEAVRIANFHDYFPMARIYVANFLGQTPAYRCLALADCVRV